MIVSLNCLTGLYSKLRANFNAKLAAVAVQYQLASSEIFTIDFPASVLDKPSVSCFFGRLAPAEVEVGIAKPTRMSFWVDRAENLRDEKMRDFAGVVVVGLDVTLYWRAGNSNEVNFNRLALAVEDAIAECVQAFERQTWGAGVVYDGQFTATYGSVENDDKGGFQQVNQYRFIFGQYT